MARALYSLRIFASGGLSSSAGRVGPTVPAGLIYVLRDIDAIEFSGTSAVALETFNPLGGLLAYFLSPTPYAVTNFEWRGRQVFDEGEQVGFQASGGNWAVMASGYQLTKP